MTDVIGKILDLKTGQIVSPGSLRESGADKDKYIARLEEEIRNHAAWAESIVNDPKAKPIVAMLQENERLRKRIAELEAELADWRQGKHTTSQTKS